MSPTPAPTPVTFGTERDRCQGDTFHFRHRKRRCQERCQKSVWTGVQKVSEKCLKSVWHVPEIILMVISLKGLPPPSEKPANLKVVPSWLPEKPTNSKVAQTRTIKKPANSKVVPVRHMKNPQIQKVLKPWPTNTSQISKFHILGTAVITNLKASIEWSSGRAIKQPCRGAL